VKSGNDNKIAARGCFIEKSLCLETTLRLQKIITIKNKKL
jgi:hypothetical protein